MERIIASAIVGDIEGTLILRVSLLCYPFSILLSLEYYLCYEWLTWRGDPNSHPLGLTSITPINYNLENYSYAFYSFCWNDKRNCCFSFPSLFFGIIPSIWNAQNRIDTTISRAQISNCQGSALRKALGVTVSLLEFPCGVMTMFWN